MDWMKLIETAATVALVLTPFHLANRKSHRDQSERIAKIEFQVGLMYQDFEKRVLDK